MLILNLFCGIISTFGARILNDESPAVNRQPLFVVISWISTASALVGFVEMK